MQLVLSRNNAGAVVGRIDAVLDHIGTLPSNMKIYLAEIVRVRIMLLCGFKVIIVIIDKLYSIQYIDRRTHMFITSSLRLYHISDFGSSIFGHISYESGYIFYSEKTWGMI